VEGHPDGVSFHKPKKSTNDIGLLYSCHLVYEDIKPKKRIAARSAAILFLGFAFVLTQSTAAI